MIKKARLKNKNKLPPHTWEAHPSANQGEANKQLIIAVITISAIIVLGALLLFSDKIAGKAFFVPEAKFTAGIVDPGKILENTPFSLIIKTNIETKNTVAIDFKLNLPEGLTCDDLGNDLQVNDLLNWGEGLVFDTAECLGSQIVFKYATVNAAEARSEEFALAQLQFQKGAPVGVYDLTFESFNIYDLDDKAHPDLIINGESAEIVVEEKVTEGCGDGIVDVGENCANCPEDVKCSAGSICSEAGLCVKEQVCTPNEFFCSGDKKVLSKCSADGKSFINTPCLEGWECNHGIGACEMLAPPPLCNSDEKACANATNIKICDQDGSDWIIQPACKADETCQAGACQPKAVVSVCTDTDPADTDLAGVLGLNYFEKGTASDGTTSAADKCKSDIILTEKFCKDNVITSQDVDCKSYAKNDYICKDDACVAKSTIPMKIELLGISGLAVAATETLTLGEDYQVKVTVFPLKEDLGKHLLIVQLAYNNQSNTYIYENKGNLSIEEEETIEFAHQLANKGEMKIEAFVWGNWPSAGTGKALLDKVEVKYEVK
ncbi:MAG TPA: hypothetical protein VJA23_04850 [Candidatus Nanoarchaeia archaeon]|nr:hypothetical protein [Candidatus Nanoarchaeia archaeon]